MLRFVNGSELTDSDDLLRMLQSEYALQYQSTLSVVLCCIYGALCLFGLTGNGWAICVILRKKMSTIASVNDGLVLYILSLCVVDFLLLSVTPLVILELILQRWIHGQVICKFFWAVESGGKVLSVFLLTALSFDRYLAVCLCKTMDGTHPWRTVRATLTVIVGSAAVCAMLLTPVYACVHIQYHVIELTVDNDTIFFEVPKCSLAMSTQLLKIFAVYMFMSGFVTPAVLIAWFYWKIIDRLKIQIRCMDGVRVTSRIPIGRVVRITSAVIIFYFFCQTPYWCNNLYLALDPMNAARQSTTFRKFIAHVLTSPRRETLTSRFCGSSRRVTHPSPALFNAKTVPCDYQKFIAKNERNKKHNLKQKCFNDDDAEVPLRQLEKSRSKSHESTNEIFL